MASLFEGIDRDTLVSWRSDAQAALNRLMIGDHDVQVRHNEKWVTYQRVDLDKLRGYIAQLTAAINGLGAPSGVGIVF